MKNNKLNLIIATLIVIAAAISKVVLYPNSFSPIIAMAIFAGAIFTNKKYAFVLPLAAMLLSDILFEVSGIAQGFWGVGQVFGYAILGLITVLAFTMKKVNVLNIALYGVGSAFVFFFLSNFTVWMFDTSMYEKSFAGLMKCYAMGVPFLKTSIVSTLLYSVIFFGSYYLIAAQKKVIA